MKMITRLLAAMLCLFAGLAALPVRAQPAPAAAPKANVAPAPPRPALWKLADDNLLGGGGGASADEGGEAVALGVEDPNQIMQSTAAPTGQDGW